MTRCAICRRLIDVVSSHYVLERGHARRSDIHLCSLRCLAAATDPQEPR